MSSRTPPLNSLRVLEAAARLLSFKKAAEELHVTPAAVSHQVSQLESLLGMPLFKRVNQGIELTAAARMSLPKLQQGMECLRDAVEQMQAHARAKIITVTAAPSFAMCWLMPRLHRFILANPEIDVHVNTQLGPYFGSRGAQVVEGNVHAWASASDVVLVYGKGRYGDLKVHRLLPLTITPLCSPRLLQGERPLTTPESLAGHTLLHDGRGTQTEYKPYWGLWCKAMRLEHFPTDAGPRFAHALLALNAAAEGHGIVTSTPQLAVGHIESGKLVAPFALELPIDSAYFVASTRAAFEREDVARFWAWLQAEAAAVPPAPQARST